MEEAIEGYTAAAHELIDRFNAVSSSILFKPVVDLLPAPSARVADIGAGPGRDAAWLANMGHSVLAVEPVKQFRDAGMTIHSSPRIEWIDDRLPDLIETRRRGRFDLVLLSAVWQHLNDHQRPIAMRSLADLTPSGGLLIMSLRHGTGGTERFVYPVVPRETIEAALSEGFTLLRQGKLRPCNLPIEGAGFVGLGLPCRDAKPSNENWSKSPVGQRGPLWVKNRLMRCSKQASSITWSARSNMEVGIVRMSTARLQGHHKM